MTDPKPKIVVYEDQDFRGSSREFTDDVTSLYAHGFQDRTSSIKVFGSVWVAYDDKEFKGQQYLLEEGEYSKWDKWGGSNDNLRSLKMLNTDNLGLTPNIELYNGLTFAEEKHVFEYAINELAFYNFNDKTLSIKVKQGTWVLFSRSDYKGQQWILGEGEYPHNAGFGNNAINSLRPVKEPAFTTEILSMTFDIGSGILSTTPHALVEMGETNDTSLEQIPSWGTSVTKTTSKTYEWHWDNSTVIGGSYTFSTGVPIIAEGEISMSAENTFNVGESSSEENTEDKEWNINLPGKVAPHTRMEVKASVQEGKMDVPFKATLQRGTKVWEEQGTYYGVQCFHLETEFHETPL